MMSGRREEGRRKEGSKEEVSWGVEEEVRGNE